MTTRRATTNATLAALITTLVMEATFIGKPANALDFGLTAPNQTLEQAEGGIRGHARSLLRVKDLLEEGSWKAAQKTLRKSSAELKQDMYTMIQAKPGSERAELRRMYTKLFNNVTKLDYAAESNENVAVVWECYDNIVLALNDIMSRLLY
ncbi:OLC1v1012021C2 [Oldenlandia corymbosa var. corymbosa]|nr:OLC1v1012021C2 [Oldenlandia corymbosa var. corymbosa]